MFSSIAAFATRFDNTDPDDTCNGENNSLDIGFPSPERSPNMM